MLQKNRGRKDHFYVDFIDHGQNIINVILDRFSPIFHQ
jgi:hypothetical protein